MFNDGLRTLEVARQIETQGHTLACTGTRMVYRWSKETREGYIHLGGHVWKVVCGEYGRLATLVENMGKGRVSERGFVWKKEKVQEGA